MQRLQGWDLGDAGEHTWQSRQPQAAPGSNAPGAQASKVMTMLIGLGSHHTTMTRSTPECAAIKS